MLEEKLTNRNPISLIWIKKNFLKSCANGGDLHEAVNIQLFLIYQNINVMQSNLCFKLMLQNL